MEMIRDASWMCNSQIIFVLRLTIQYPFSLYYFIAMCSWDIVILAFLLTINQFPPTIIKNLEIHLWIHFPHPIWWIIFQIFIPKGCGWHVYIPSLIFFVIVIQWKVIVVNGGLQLSLRNWIVWHIYCMLFQKPNNIFEVLLVLIKI